VRPDSELNAVGATACVAGRRSGCKVDRVRRVVGGTLRVDMRLWLQGSSAVEVISGGGQRRVVEICMWTNLFSETSLAAPRRRP
jgi:hypothetical protein